MKSYMACSCLVVPYREGQCLGSYPLEYSLECLRSPSTVNSCSLAASFHWVLGVHHFTVDTIESYFKEPICLYTLILCTFWLRKALGPRCLPLWKRSVEPVAQFSHAGKLMASFGTILQDCTKSGRRKWLGRWLIGTKMWRPHYVGHRLLPLQWV